MKWKSLIIISVLFILGFLIIFNSFKMKKDLTLKVAMFYETKKPSDIDPSRIHFSSEYLYLENIYSPLVEYNINGELVAGVSKSFRWEGNEAIFEIREDLYTADGYKITAYDVEKSFKRLFILSTNTHGNLKDMLCPNIELKSIGESCPNMEVRDNGKIFVMRFKKKHPFLFPMLTAIDFAVIPSISIDDKTLEIKDHRNTSGPYYVLSEDKLDLQANQKHYHYNEKMPQKIIYVYPKEQTVDSMIDLLKSNEIDHIPTGGVGTYPLIKFHRENRDINIHLTYPFKLFMLGFTNKGIKRFDSIKRFKIGLIMRQLFLPRYQPSQEFIPTYQIFPVISEGNLASEQLNKLISKINSIKLPGIIKDKISILNSPEIPELKEVFPNIKYVYLKGIYGKIDFKKEKIDEPDLFFFITDMSFQEDINLLTYSINANIFKVRNNEAKLWLKDYMETDDKSERIKKLNKLHYETLSEGYVFPIVFAPYAAILRKPWKFGLSKYYANNPIWRIYRE